MTLPDAAEPGPEPAVAEHEKWVRPSVAVLLVATAVLYLWNLASNAWGNSFYAMAVQAGTQSWKALFFGSLDAGNIVTVDKPPFSLWIMGLSGRIFGFSSWSMLIPDALAGVASVGLLYLAVRRTSGPVAGLLAGSALALTPVAALMFRFNNPDAFLVLLLVAGAYCAVRAIETASTKWLLLAGVAIGFGFLDKMLQAFVVLPAFVLAYAVAAPTSLGRRIWQLFAAAGAVAVSAGWWVLAVALWPVADRPYISGSTNNSVLELAFGYNGLGRIFGNERPGGGAGGARGALPADLPPDVAQFVRGGGGGGGFGGATGLTRLFSQTFGGEASWLLPTALIGLVAGLWFTRRAPRTDRTRAALLLWGGWTVVTVVVLSYMSGIIHPYYTVALAPGIVATAGIAGRELWQGRKNLTARIALALMIASAAVWGFILLNRDASWQPWVRYVLVAAAALAVIGVLLGVDRVRRAAPAVAVLGLCGTLLGTGAFTIATAATSHAGGMASSGPASAAGAAGRGGGFGGGARPGGAARPGGTTARPGDTTRGAGGFGQDQANPQLIALLKATTNKWAAAQTAAMQSATLALDSGRPVIAIGGFSGSDPAPTLQQFEQYVAAGDVHYYVSSAGGRGGGFGGFGGGQSDASQIQTWVEAHYTKKTVGTATVYDLTAAAH
jgi:4-amino-4-deoxy-L-arabinose transferase-like glycosyltransferase